MLAGCISAESREATRLLEDIDAGAGPSALKRETPAPSREAVVLAVGPRRTFADLYRPGEGTAGHLVLVPGFTDLGKDDPRVVALAESFARVRFAVLVPDLPGTRGFRVEPGDIGRISDAVVAFPTVGGETRPLGIAAISYAVGPAITAALDARSGPSVDFLVGLGGYHDARRVIGYATTGYYREHGGGTWVYREPHALARWVFLASNAEAVESFSDRDILEMVAERKIHDPEAAIDDLARHLGSEGRALLALMDNRDPDRVPALIAALPAAVRARIDSMSLADRDLSSLSGRLILIHGRDDNMVPYVESVALAEAAGEAELFVVPGFTHIDPRSVGLLGRLALVDAAQAILARRR